MKKISDDKTKNYESVMFENNSEDELLVADDSIYNISSYGTDIGLKQIVDYYNDGDIVRPDLQRNYVWDKKTASRFIETILLGLPVPAIFLSKTKDNKFIIVDGLQRITTICNFFNGITAKDGKPFKLLNSEIIVKQWRGKTFNELDEKDIRSLKMYPMHAIVFEQKKPDDNSSLFQIFERINTSGVKLTNQEVRNCIYSGMFNKLLFKLNENTIWRNILNKQVDARMNDIELILRILAFAKFDQSNNYKQKSICLKKFLNDYMGKMKDISINDSKLIEKEFITIITYLYKQIGKQLFRRANIDLDNKTNWIDLINPVIADAVYSATYKKYIENNGNIDSIGCKSLASKYEKLVLDCNFQELIKQHTTTIENIRKRIKIAYKYLYG